MKCHLEDTETGWVEENKEMSSKGFGRGRKGSAVEVGE